MPGVREPLEEMMPQLVLVALKGLVADRLIVSEDVDLAPRGVTGCHSPRPNCHPRGVAGVAGSGLPLIAWPSRAIRPAQSVACPPLTRHQATSSGHVIRPRHQATSSGHIIAYWRL